VLLTEAIGIRSGERVLITPAGGGLGCLLVQLAHAAGAEVVAAARGPRKLALARELGAHETVDYSDSDWPLLVRGVDVALDGVGGAIGRACFDLTVPGGRFLAFGVPGGGFTMIDPAEARARGVRYWSLLELEWRAADERGLAERALAMAAEGRIRPVIGNTVPLTQAAAAHAAIESRSVTGKTLLTVR
jgi:NADPH2:quinone reductase